MSIWTIHDLHDAVFGVDSRKVLGEKLRGYGSTKALLIYDEAMGPLGFVEELVGIIKAEGLEAVTYQLEPGEPSTDKIDRVIAYANENKIDGIVALGGGSCIDTAKLAGKTIANGGFKSEEFLSGYTAVGGTEKRYSPIIALPTTSGTGSEVSYGLMAENVNLKKKIFTIHPATLAINDPVYTYGLPKAVTAMTGIDALTHAAESLCNSEAMPNWMADIICKECIRLVFKWLPIAYNDGGNVEARSAMSFAAMLGGYAITLRKTTFGHAVANQISDKYHLSHGISVSMGIAAVVRYNVTADPVSTGLIAECCGVDCPEGADMVKVGNKVVEAFDALLKGVGMKTMKEMGIPRNFVDYIADQVAVDPKWKMVPNPPNFDIMRKALHDSYDY